MWAFLCTLTVRTQGKEKTPSNKYLHALILFNQLLFLKFRKSISFVSFFQFLSFYSVALFETNKQNPPTGKKPKPNSNIQLIYEQISLFPLQKFMIVPWGQLSKGESSVVSISKLWIAVFTILISAPGDSFHFNQQKGKTRLILKQTWSIEQDSSDLRLHWCTQADVPYVPTGDHTFLRPFWGADAVPCFKSWAGLPELQRATDYS